MFSDEGLVTKSLEDMRLEIESLQAAVSYTHLTLPTILLV